MSNELNSVGNWDITIGGVPVVEFTANVGAIGPQGNDGVAVANAPITYNAMTRTIGLDPTYVPNALVPYATSTSVDTKIGTAIGNLVNSAPATLDTLQEIATALGNDPNLSTTLTNLIATKAPIASPTFTGDPKAPTPATGDNDTSIATTAFVKAQGYATLASPTFTGDPQAPTPATGDNDTSVATTAFVKNQGYITSGNASTAFVPRSGGSSIVSDQTDNHSRIEFIPDDGSLIGGITAGASIRSIWELNDQGLFINASNADSVSVQVTGINSIWDETENHFHLTAFGVSGVNSDSNNFNLSSGGVIFGDGNNNYHYNPNGITGDGWSITKDNGIVGLTFAGSITNNADKEWSANGDSGVVPVTASIIPSALNGLSLKWEAENSLFGSSEIKLYDGVNTFTGTNNFTGRSSFGSTTARYAGSGSDLIKITDNGNYTYGQNALTITQLGTAHALQVINNSTSQPVFTVSKSGYVGIGVFLNANPTVALSVDSTGIKYGSNATAQTVPYIPSAVAITGGTISGVTISNYATLASPTFTGDPKAPTPNTGDNDTSIATTQFVKSQAYATLASPIFTGDPKAPTPNTGDNDFSIANTAFVKAQGYATLASPTFTGDVYISTIRNPLNQNLVVDAYHDTGAGVHNYFNFNPYTAGFELPTNSSGIKFGDGSTQVSAFIPANYAQLAGANFTGKVSFNAGLTTAPLNIATGVSPSGVNAGDLWIGTTNLSFKDSTGVTRNTVATSTSNNFTNWQNITQNSSAIPSLTVVQGGAGGGLKITNTGSGESLRVEDDTSPDATAFVVSNNGRVGIGVAPDATVALSVDATGIKVNGATLIPASAVTDQTITSGNMSHSEYLKELVITINGVNYAIPLRVV